ncbi:MAG TPA: hypothetical protein VGB62_09790 [Allosphingosinicella sp.]
MEDEVGRGDDRRAGEGDVEVGQAVFVDIAVDVGLAAGFRSEARPARR